MRKNNITYSMHKAISAAGSVHRKTFTRFFGQGAFSLFFRPCIPNVNIIRPCAPYRQIASGDMESGLFVWFLYRIPTIEYKKAEICNNSFSRIKYICWIGSTMSQSDQTMVNNAQKQYHILHE
jgi:hypothetical protein